MHPLDPLRIPVNARARRLLSAVATASAAAALVLEATGAAHAAPKPPKLAGYVSYGSVATTVACASGVPTSVTFTATYDATHLTGTPKLEAFGHLVDGSTSYWYNDLPDFQPTAGSTGTYTTTFNVGTIAKKLNGSAVITTDIERNNYVFASRTVPLTCASATAATVTAPAVTASPVDCNGHSTLTFDNTHGTQKWTYGAYDVSEGLRQPADTAIAAGRSTTVTQGVVPGDELEFRVVSPTAVLDLGSIAFTTRCSQAVFGPASPLDNPTAGGQQSVMIYLINQDGSPAKHKAVSYQVTGANSASGTTQTDGSGKATFKYAAKHAGVDTLTATFGKAHASVKYTIARRPEHPHLVVSHRGGHLVAVVATRPVAKNVTVQLTATVGGKDVSRTSSTDKRGVATFALPKGLGVQKVVTRLKSKKKHGHASVRTSLKHVKVSLSAQVLDKDYDPTPSNTVTTKG